MSNDGATFVPQDGTVEGWRFVKTADTDPAPEPRTAPDFSAICGSTEAKADFKRVGVVIDYGTVEGSGGSSRSNLVECVQVPTSADGFAVLNAYASIGVDKGMVCSVESVPSDACPSTLAPTQQAMTLNAASDSEDSKSKGNPYLTGGIILVVAGAVIGLAQLRKSRRS